MFGFRDVEIVREVVRAGGFRAAAQRSGLSQSAISARVAALEKRLGLTLFDRVGRQVRLSMAGRRFLEEAERLIQSRDRIVQELTQSSGLNGTIRIGVAETIVHTILTSMLNSLRRDHGNVRFELSVDTSEQLARKLVDDELDIAILMPEYQPRDSLATPLKPITLDWYAREGMVPTARPLAISELAAYPVVTFPKRTTPYRQLEQLFASSQVAAPVLHGSASLFTVLHLVGDGFGIGLLPTRMAEAVGRAREQEKQLVRLPVQDEARVPDLNFVVCHLPARNREAGELITAAACEADQNDPIIRS